MSLLVRTCRECGCHDSDACVDDVAGPCWWVEGDLCSHCAQPADQLAFDDIVAAAQARAAADVALGVENLRRSIETAEEYSVSHRTDGSRHIVPERQVLLGHLRRLEAVRS